MLLAPRSRHRGRKLPRPDGRTIAVRRYRELLRQFKDELGPLTAIDQVLLEQAVALVVRGELSQVSFVRAEPAASDEFIRATSEGRRILSHLRAKSAKAKPPVPNVHDLLAEIAEAADSGAEA
jgi:hypothetical protein